MTILIILIPVLLIVFNILAGFYFATRLLNIHRHSFDRTIREGLENRDFDKAFLRSARTDFTIQKPGGETLSGFAMDGESEKTVIFCHGITWSRYGMVKYFNWFRRKGWNIIAYDHQAHGLSTGRYPTYGLKEKEDLKLVIDWAADHYSDSSCIGLFGESMGAATVLLCSSMDSRIRFVVADCPYSDFDALLHHQLKLNHLPSFFHRAVIAFADLYTRRKAGFHTGAISPEKEIMKTSVPILLVHGKEDDYVPTGMSVRMYERRKDHAPTDLLLIDGAAHAKSIRKNRPVYEAKLEEFLSFL